MSGFSYATLPHPIQQRGRTWIDDGATSLEGMCFSARQAFLSLNENSSNPAHIEYTEDYNDLSNGLTEQGVTNPPEDDWVKPTVVTPETILKSFHQHVVSYFYSPGLKMDHVKTELQFDEIFAFEDKIPRVDNSAINGHGILVLSAYPSPVFVLARGTQISCGTETLFDSSGAVLDKFKREVIKSAQPSGDAPVLLSSRRSIHWFQSHARSEGRRLLLRSAITV